MIQMVGASLDWTSRRLDLGLGVGRIPAAWEEVQIPQALMGVVRLDPTDQHASAATEGEVERVGDDQAVEFGRQRDGWRTVFMFQLQRGGSPSGDGWVAQVQEIAAVFAILTNRAAGRAVRAQSRQPEGL